MVAGAGGNMMDEENLLFMNAQSSSSGPLGIQVQAPMPYGIKFTGEFQFQSPDPNMFQQSLSLQKDFANSHLHYAFQGVHILSYMQHVTNQLCCGYQAAYIAQRGSFMWSYGAKYEINKCTFLGQYTNMNPNEKILLGVVNKPSPRLTLFA